MDSADKRALAGLLIHVHRWADVAGSCTHLTVPIQPLLVVLFLLVVVFLDIESIFLIVISMVLMLLDFLKAWPFNQKSKYGIEYEAAQDCPTSETLHPPRVLKRSAQDWKMKLAPEVIALDASLSEACNVVFGLPMTTSPTRPKRKLISIGPALMSEASKTSRICTMRALDEIARVARHAIAGAEVYGFERTRSSPGYPGGTMEAVVVVPSPCLGEQLGERLQRGMKGGQMMLSSSQLHKSALRYLIDHLVNEGFKFRCSAFKAQEPTVAVSTPHGCCGGQTVYVSLSVNNPLPFLEASLTHEVSVSDPRAVPLIATVQHWAEARGLAHPVFGPLSMYGWVHTCIYFLTQVAQPRMSPLQKEPSLCKGPREPHAQIPVDPNLVENFFEFCARFAFGRSHMWLREKYIAADAPFIQDALRPGIDLGYHLQHRVPRKQLQGEAAFAASALKNQSVDIDHLADLAPLKSKSGLQRSSDCKHWDNPACSELRMMKTTRTQQKEVPVASENLSRSSSPPSLAEEETPPSSD